MHTSTAAFHTARRLTLAPSLEGVCMACAICFAVGAMLVPLVPTEAVTWALTHIG